MEKRRRIEEGYKSALNELKKKSHFGGPDYEVTAHESLLPYDAGIWVMQKPLTVSAGFTGGSEQPHQRGRILRCSWSCSWQTGQNRRTGKRKVRYSVYLQNGACSAKVNERLFVSSLKLGRRGYRDPALSPPETSSPASAPTDSQTRLLNLLHHCTRSRFTSHILLFHFLSLFIHHYAHLPGSLVVSPPLLW